MQFYAKRIKDADNFLHVPLADTIGDIVVNILKPISDPKEAQE
jgi:hypothetical protein